MESYQLCNSKVFERSWPASHELFRHPGCSTGPPQQVDQLLNDGWTTEHFALCATSLEDFDAVMTEIFDTGLSPLHKASLRLAWKRCQSSSNQGAVAPTPAVASPEVAAQPLAGSWSETFAPKLTSANVSQIKAAFKKNCPAEVLLPENLPSLRLLSMVVHQKNKQDFKWIPGSIDSHQRNATS